jgi:hypothetical protein
MPRATVASNNTEDLMDDTHAEEWEVVSEDFGTKILWEVGTTFIGTFFGVKEVEVDDKEDGLSTALSATFADSNGEKHWCWLPYQLQQAIADGVISEGDVVRIKCTGEQPTKRGLNKVKTFTIQRKPR